MRDCGGGDGGGDNPRGSQSEEGLLGGVEAVCDSPASSCGASTDDSGLHPSTMQ